jgi:hypothetical protein
MLLIKKGPEICMSFAAITDLAKGIFYCTSHTEGRKFSCFRHTQMPTA